MGYAADADGMDKLYAEEHVGEEHVGEEHKPRSVSQGDIVWYQGSLLDRHDIYVVAAVSPEQLPEDAPTSWRSSDDKRYVLRLKDKDTYANLGWLRNVRRQSFTFLTEGQ